MTILQQLNAIHNRVKKNFTYLTDQEQYGNVEKWVMPNGHLKFVGDCEDFALACRAMCREQNIPSRLVFCAIGQEGHCVLTVEGYILDNNEDRVVSWQEVPHYTWISISGYEPGDDWHSLEANNK